MTEHLEAIQALDLSTFNAKADALTAEMAEIRAAIAKADDRRAEIGAELAKSPAQNAEALASALVAGGEASEAAEVAPDRDRLILERENLREARTALDQRLRQAQIDWQANKDEAAKRVQDALAPMAAEIRAEARDAAQRLVDCYAAARAIEDAVKGFAGLVLPCRVAVEGVAGANRLLDYRRHVPVPPAVVDVVSNIPKLGPVMKGVTVRNEIGMP